MAKQYTGYSYDFRDHPVDAVTTAYLTKTELHLEWQEGSYLGALTATSDDGVVYVGTFRYQGWPTEVYHARLGVYRGPNNTILLFGDWWEDGSIERATWLLQLRPKSEK